MLKRHAREQILNRALLIELAETSDEARTSLGEVGRLGFEVGR